MRPVSVLISSRNSLRFAVAGLAAALMGGCSSGGFSDPFSNPFSSTGSIAKPSGGSLSSPPGGYAGQSSGYGNPDGYGASRRVASTRSTAYSDPAPRMSRPTPVGGSAAGWTATGGTPIVLAQGESVGVIAQRYGVPSSAILKTNGFESASEVRAGTRLVIPVYHGRGGSDVESPTRARHVDVADRVRAHKRKHVAERDEDDDRSSRKARHRDRDHADRDDAPSHRRTDRDEDRDTDHKSRRADDDHNSIRKRHRKVEESEARRSDEDRDTVRKPRRTAEERDEGRHAKSRRREDDDREEHHAKAHRRDDSERDTRHAETRTTRRDEADGERPSKKEKVREVASAEDRKSREPEPAPRKQQVASRTPATTDATPTASVAGGKGEFRWPARGRIIQGFKPGGNDGINIAVPEGTSVKAVEGGVVAYAGSELKGYGNMVLIRHPNGFVSAYANNGELNVKRGEAVKRGQTIARSGQSGNVSAPQLHFELRKGSTPVDPTNYLAGT